MDINIIECLDKYKIDHDFESLKRGIISICGLNDDGNISIVPPEKSVGLVLSVNTDGSLNTNGYERGFLIIPPGSGIREHSHSIFSNVEMYYCYDKNCDFMGDSLTEPYNNSDDFNVCVKGTHGIKISDSFRTVNYYKISERMIRDEESVISSYLLYLKYYRNEHN